MGNCHLGLCGEIPKEHLEIEQNLQKEEKKEKQKRKLLLLGAGSSGKSTLLKQMKYLYVYENDYPQKELEAFRDTALLNVLNIFKILCQQLNKLNLECQTHNQNAMKEILALSATEETFSIETKSYLKQLSMDESIRKVITIRDPYNIHDNTKYFLRELERILDGNYEPTFRDVLKTRVKTTGVIEEEFLYQKARNKSERYLVVDVGGQRSERSKWIGQFSDVMMVLWVFALSSYDQMLKEREASDVNRMHEEFELFRSTNHRPELNKTNFIVFLNKNDQFEEKLKLIPFNFSFEEHKYEGDKHDGLEITTWIKDTMRAIDTHDYLYFHVITALDTAKFNVVFGDCHETILQERFKGAGVW